MTIKLPNFLVVGAHKSGTSSLYFYLKQHPDIYMSPIKELDFFNRSGIDWENLKKYDLEQLPNYIPELKTYISNFKNVKNEKAIGEATTAYLCKPEPPELIHNLLPDVKIIAILRNPVDRAYSHFHHRLRLGIEPFSDFSVALRKDKQSFCAGYKGRGLYHEQLQRYLKRFDAQQIKVCLFEDMVENPQKLMEELFMFLEINHYFLVKSIHENIGFTPFYPTLNRILIDRNPLLNFYQKVFLRSYNLQKRKNLNKLKASILVFLPSHKIPPISLETRQELIQYFYSDILKLQDLIQRDLSHWLCP